MAEIPNQTYSNNQDSISLKEVIYKFKMLFNFLISKWLLFVFFGLLGGGLGLGYAFISKPVYKATFSFALEDEKSSGGVGLSGALGLASSLGIDLGTSAGGAFSGANLMELMRSRKMIEKALLNTVNINGKETTLADLFINFKGLNAGWESIPRLSGLSYNSKIERAKFTLQQDSVLGLIHSTIVGVEGNGMMNVFQKDKKVSIINLEVKATNEVFAKAFVESLAKEVSLFYVETKSKKASMNVAILQRQADSIRTELNNAIAGVASANDNIYNLNPAFSLNRTPSTKRQVDVQANTAILTQLVTNLEMAKVTLLKETPLIQVIDKPILPLEKDKVSKKKSLIIGGLLGGFLVLIVLIGKMVWEKYILDNI